MPSQTVIRSSLILFALFVLLQTGFTQSSPPSPAAHLSGNTDTAGQKMPSVNPVISDSLQRALTDLVRETKLYLAPKEKKSSPWEWSEFLKKPFELIASIIGILVGLPGLRRVIKNKFREEEAKPIRDKQTDAPIIPEKVMDVVSYIGIVFLIYFLGSIVVNMAQTILLSILACLGLLIILSYVILQYWKFFDPHPLSLPNEFVVSVILDDRYDFSSGDKDMIIGTQRMLQRLVDQMDHHQHPALIYLYTGKKNAANFFDVFIQCNDPQIREILERVTQKFMSSQI